MHPGSYFLIFIHEPQICNFLYKEIFLYFTLVVTAASYPFNPVQGCDLVLVSINIFSKTDFSFLRVSEKSTDYIRL